MVAAPVPVAAIPMQAIQAGVPLGQRIGRLDGEPYWRWECKCGDSRGRYKSETTALSKGDRHFLDGNSGKLKPQGPEDPGDVKPIDRAAAERLEAKREGKIPDDEARSMEAKRQRTARSDLSSQPSSSETFDSDSWEKRAAHERTQDRYERQKDRRDRRRQS